MSIDFRFASRRSCVLSRRGMVATSQPLAAEAGLAELRRGGNAADAAIATAALLVVTEPIANGIGGDAFALYYDAKTREITALNGSGRSAASSDAAALRARGLREMPLYTGATVTVPGAVRAWADLLERHGTRGLADLLRPAVETAERGFPVGAWTAHAWRRSVAKLLRGPGWEHADGPPQPSGNELLLHGRAPRPGEVMALPTLAATLRHIAAEGPAWLYEGSFAARAAAHVRDYGGWLDAEDFARHESEWTTPISTVYRGLRVHECPPNGQGLAALVALNALNAADLDGRNETEILVRHLECMRLGFQAAGRAVCDPAWAKEDVGRLLEPARGRALLADVDPSRAFAGPLFGRTGSDTVHAAVVDGEGNACSWIQSCYMGTGTGLVVPGTGVSLQNRGAGFSLDPDHPNTLEGGKRPYHTIIPAMVTVDGALHACFGVVGGFMQPQGHVQVVTHLAAGRNPQQALDAARWQLEGHGARVLLEPGFPAHVVRALQDRGYVVREVDGFERVHMGGGQVIVRDAESGVLAGGSDPRRDGCAIGF